ncbi:hypothetical protein D9613_001720 [Agrocybe pediades]|uniref:Uncharacterized protein n=1 Tax=Agrocybe pediades TaxID=84607 RepID=A0A8H4R608_9AGAR|nr:hypothetical protein D9613_001720 [Agrocybe pediades]
MAVLHYVLFHATTTAMTLGKSTRESDDEEAAKAAAAIMIQRLWRGRHNLTKDRHLNPDLRWDDAANNAKLAVYRNKALEDTGTPRERWRRAVFLISQLKFKNDMLKDNGVQVEAQEKHLEAQHWLELIDGKHRYGSNLKVETWYHKKWQEEDTNENFFKWLDYGGGKDLSLDECPRERLDKERIIYLSAEQRLNYLVKIGEDGKLYWEKNNQPVDTTAGDWKDAGDGQGIVPETMPMPSGHGKLQSLRQATGLQPVDSKDQENAATHYAGHSQQGGHSWSRSIRRSFTMRGVMDRLLRKTVKRNTWIYVADKNCMSLYDVLRSIANKREKVNIFIGIKETGSFQHSSFVAGGIVTSAGLISVKQGVIHTLSPLSGHYRTTVDHFHRFIEVLDERGVDMHKVKISKAEAALWGIEHIAKFKKKQSHALSSGKKKVQETSHHAKVFIAAKSPGDTKWKKEILKGRPSSKSDYSQMSNKQEEKGKSADHGG